MHVQAHTVVAVNLRHVVVKLTTISEGILNGHKVLVGIGEPESAFLNELTHYLQVTQHSEISYLYLKVVYALG